MSVSRFSCLIIDEMHASILPMLKEIGVDAIYRPDIKTQEVPDAIQGFEGLIVRSKLKITPEVLQKADTLRFIARAGAGMDNIDPRVVDAGKITLLNASEGNRDAVGEHCVGLLLCLLRNIARADQQVRAKVWLREENRGYEIGGKTVGIIGYGNMGQAFARCLTSFNCQVLAHDLLPDGKEGPSARLTDLSEIFEKADILSLHIPLDEQNYHFADETFFESFRKNIWFLNTARGEVVDQEALVRQLQSGKVRGAALDVLENEKLGTLSEQQLTSFSYLTQSPNVILTPHIAGWTHESYRRINEVLVEKIKGFLTDSEA
jgi:D-3-phosphoglycerate dehydrogenase / 2-oxoglutarate reductase